jgi:ribosomal protein S18 acetylase RimI-like enzyme
MSTEKEKLSSRAEILRMSEADLDEIIAMGLSTSPIQTGTDSPQFYHRETLRRWIQSPNEILLVARVDGNLAGFGITNYNPDFSVGHLHITVAGREYLRKGVDSELLDATLTELEELGCEHVYCEIEEYNVITLQLFRKHGFGIETNLIRVKRKLPREETPHHL